MLYAMLEQHARERPSQVALLGLDGTAVHYGELRTRLAQVQQWIASTGILPGQVVAVAMGNSVATVLTLLGASLRATLTPLDPMLGAMEMQAVLAHVGAQAVLTDTEHVQRLEPVAASCGIPLHVVPSDQVLVTQGSGSEDLHPPAEDHVLLLHRTSGTTGTSKRVPLRRSNISTQARNTAESLLLTPADRIVQVMPLFHMHGFGCMSGTLWSGGTVVCVPGHDGSRYADWSRRYHPTWFSASPTILNDLVRLHRQHPTLATEVPYRFIRSLSAAIPFGLIEELERITGAPVVEQYGLTEALSPVIANRPVPGERKIGSIGRPYRNEVWVVDSQGRELPHGGLGELVVRGPGVISGYAEPEAVNTGSWFTDRFRTGDLGYLDDDGFVYITGRLKEEINRGGEKISPQEVEAALSGHASVKAMAAFGVPHPTLGEEVAMAFVPDRPNVDVAGLRLWMLERIAPQKVPKQFFPVTELPITSTGKVKRAELVKLFQQSAVPAREDHTASLHTESYDRAMHLAYEATSVEQATHPEQLPSDYIERTVAMVWGQELGLDRVLLTDDFFALGGDSLSGVRVSARLRVMLGCQVALSDLFQNPVLSDFTAALGRSGHAQRWTNLSPIRLTGDKVPFVCVHGDEGNYNLPRLLSADRPFLGFMHQGEDGKGMPFRTIKSIARHYVKELLEARPEGPYIVAGFSTGGVIAYEMALRLQVLGKSVPLLVLFDARGPAFNWWRFAPRTKLSAVRGDLLRPRCERYLERGQPIPYKLRNFYIINTYRRALDRYRPKPYTGNVLFLRSDQRSHEPAGWDGLLNGNMQTKVVPGEHLTILREPYVKTVVSELETFLRAKGL